MTHMGLKCSLLYQELTQAELAAIVKKHFQTEDFAYTLLEGGMFNTTYRLNVGGEKFVLRMGPVNRHLLVPFERSLMQGEVAFYRQCRAANLPVSDVFALDTQREIVDRDYMIVRFVENIGMFTLEEGSDAWNTAMENVGRFTARMHAITGDCFARTSDAVAGRGYATWRAFIFSELEAIFSCYRKVDQYTAEELNVIEQAFVRHAALLDEITVPRLTHVDIWHGNVLLKNDGSGEIAAIIDGDRSLWGDVDFDLQKLWTNNAHFLRGYGEKQIITPQREIRRQLYRLLMYLIDGYVWTYEYQMPENGQHCHDQALKLAASL